MSEYSTFSYNTENLGLLPSRPAESNKGTFGRVLCGCGSYGMAGAAYLAAKAALRMGAGLVEILTPKCNLPILQTLLPEAIVSVYDEEQPSSIDVEKAVGRADVIVCGCGLGVSQTSRFVLSHVLRASASTPTVHDADELNLISRNPSLLKYAKGKIITPHPAEMSRLTGMSVCEIVSSYEQTATDFAKAHGLICVLKGHNTRVCDGGERIYINNSGNSALATAGSGDVLAGIIGGILAQSRGEESLSTLECACLGVYIHGLCGEVASAELSEYSVIASDIIDALPRVLKGI